ncbi:TonB-dependent receptor [bacterium]|nr:TonB-dependent receptor [bacterium]
MSSPAFTKSITLGFCLLVFPLIALARVTGSIHGIVTDKNSGEPLFGVVISAGHQRASTGTDGSYRLIGLEPGTVQLKAESDQYPAQFFSVSIIPEQIVEFNIELSTEPLENPLQAGKTKHIATSNVSTLTSEQIKFLPRRSNQEIILSSSASVYEQFGNLHVRGGTANELGYYANGLRLNDAFTGQVFQKIPTIALDQVTLLSGGMQAAYGDYSSGIVHLIPKRGTDKLTFFAEANTDAAAPIMGSESYKRNSFSLAAGGPLGSDQLRFFVAGEFSSSGDAEPGYHGYPKFNLSESGNRNADPTVPDTAIFQNDGNGNVLFKHGPRPGKSNSENEHTIYGNLSYDWNRWQVDMTGLYSFNERNWFSTEYLFNPGQVPHSERTTLQSGLSFKWFIQPQMIVQFGGNYYQTHHTTTNRRYFGTAQKDLSVLSGLNTGTTGFTTFYNDNLFLDINRGYNYYTEGESQSISGFSDFQWQVDPYNLIKTGIEWRNYTIRQFNLYDPDNPLTGSNDYYGYDVVSSGGKIQLKTTGQSGLDGAKNPNTKSLYIQDVFNYRSFQIEAGLRWESFNSGTRQLKNLADPTGQNDPDQFGHINPKTGYPQAGTLGEEDFKAGSSITNISPRIAAGYQLNDEWSFRAHWGRFYQNPNLQDMYVGTGFLERQTLAPYISAPVGNSGLKPQRTDELELGFDLQLDPRFELHVSRYYKFQKDMIVAGRILSIPNSLLSVGNFPASVHVFGWDIGMKAQPTEHLLTDFNIGIVSIRAKASTAQPGFNSAWLGIAETTYSFHFPHERPVNIIAALNYKLGNGEGFGLGKFKPISNSSFTIRFRELSGTPYTTTTIVPIQVVVVPQGRVIERTNSSRTPTESSFDFKYTKSFNIDRCHLMIYFEITNLLNQKDVVYVFPATGSPTDNGFLSTNAGQSLNERQLQQYQARFKENAFLRPPRQVNIGINFEF